MNNAVDFDKINLTSAQGRMPQEMVMKIRCTCCGSAKFIFTGSKLAGNRHHGARCACCRKPLSADDLLPNTAVDPIARCLIGQRKNH